MLELYSFINHNHRFATNMSSAKVVESILLESIGYVEFAKKTMTYFIIYKLYALHR